MKKIKVEEILFVGSPMIPIMEEQEETQIGYGVANIFEDNQLSLV